MKMCQGWSAGGVAVWVGVGVRVEVAVRVGVGDGTTALLTRTEIGKITSEWS